MKWTDRSKLICFFFVMLFVFSFVSVSSADSQAQLNQLYEAAKADGKIVWSWPTSAKLIEPAAKIFRTKYPDLNLSVVSISATSLGSRIITEANSNRLSIDVGSALLSYLVPVIKRDLIVQYDWTKIVNVSHTRVSYDGRLIHFMEVPRVWIYNTNLVSKDDAPKTWGDTLDDKWKGGKITLRAAPSGFASLFPIWKKDKEKTIDYLKRLAKQNVLPGKRDSEVVNRIATGECMIGIVGANIALNAIRKKAPIALCPIGPTASDPGAYFIPKGAPHPNAAKFLMAWLASEEGTQAVVDCGFGPAFPPEASPMAKLLADNGIAFTPILSVEDNQEYSGPFAKAVMSTMGFLPK